MAETRDESAANAGALNVIRLISFSDAVFAIAKPPPSPLMSATLWEYARHAGLTEPHLNPRFRYYFTLRPVVVAAVFLVSIGVAFANPKAASRLWFVAFPALLVLRLLSRDPED